MLSASGSALLRSAGVSPPTFNVPRAVDEWFGTVGNLLGGLYPGQPSALAISEAADQAASKLHAWMGPVVLAVLAPCQVVRCEARELPVLSKAEVHRQLPGFLGRVLGQWHDGALRISSPTTA